MFGRYTRSIQIKDWKAYIILLCIVGGIFQLLSTIGSNMKCLSVFKDGDYLPTDAACVDSSVRYRRRLGSRARHRVYNNTYRYYVDGEEYKVTLYSQPSDMWGKTGVLYYKPDDPTAVATYKSTADWFFEVGFLKYLFSVVMIAIGLVGGRIYLKKQGYGIGDSIERMAGGGTVINDDMDFLDDNDSY